MPENRPTSRVRNTRNTAIVAGATMVLVLWVVVGAMMLFSSGGDQPVTQTAPSKTPTVAAASKPKPKPSVDGYSPSTYTGPLPTLAAGKAPVPTAHPAQTTAPFMPNTSTQPSTQPTDDSHHHWPGHHHHHHHGGR